jgi:HEAT repeat protein
MPSGFMGRQLRHTVRAAVFCAALLVGGFVLLFHTSAAKPDPIVGLLKLPAPAPPNPMVHAPRRFTDEQLHDRLKMPDDNAPIEDLIEYWREASATYEKLRYNAQPSDRTRDRLLREVQADPKLLATLLNTFNDDPKAADAIYEIYSREGTSGALDRESRKIVRSWLTYHSPYFSQELEAQASLAGDTTGYVSNQDELLALTRVDFDRARPIIDRLYSAPDQKVGRVLAQWALYRRGLDSGSSMDVDRYRKELQDVVEDKNATPGARDLALDALAQERDWPGRDEWYISLLGDETLSELKVDGQTYTGLTTQMLVSPPEKYVPRMIELLKSSDPVVRGNVVRNLVTQIETGGPDVVRALLPWLEDEKWAKDTGDTRAAIVRKLAEIEIPESVPGLIKVLEEKRTVMVPKGTMNANVYAAMNAANAAMANAVNQITNAMNAASSVTRYANSSSNVATVHVPMEPAEQYPYRSAAVYALTKQKDPRAVPALKRTLNAIEGWERESVVKAVFVSGGFALNEQLDALETAARGVRSGGDFDGAYPSYANTTVNTVSRATNTYSGADYAERLAAQNKPLTPLELRQMLGQVIITNNEVSDELARAVVNRIEDYDKREPAMAEAYRKIVLQWPNAVVNMLFLRDTKRDVANTDTIVRLLAARKQLREKQSADLSDLRTGSQRAIGIAACLFEDKNDYDAILDSGSTAAKTALLACGRLIRAPLNVAKVAPLLAAKEPLLAEAADKYLESEDSPAARAAVLGRHQGEARIMGAMTAFTGPDAGGGYEGGSNYETLAALFASMGDPSLYNGWEGAGNDPELEQVEKRLQDEVKRDRSLIGIYAYDRNYIRIYADKAVYSFEEDDSRYHERPLTREEFENIKSYLATNRADEMAPFLYCGGAYCTSKELLMIGRNGGRRVYIAGDDIGRDPEFFAGLNKFFDAVKKEPSTLKYALSREIPGLEIVYANEGYNIATVWGDANGVSVAASEQTVRAKIQREIAAIDDSDAEPPSDPNTAQLPPEPVDGPPAPGEMSPAALAVWKKRRWEGYGWYTITSNGSLDPSTQPIGVDIIPTQGLPQNSWKGRAGSVAVRAADDGLYKLQAGRSTKLLDGAFSNAVVSADGRWVLVNRVNGEEGLLLERVDLTTRREYPVVFGNQYGNWTPMAFLPGTNAVVVQRDDGAGAPTDEEDTPPESVDVNAFKLIDAATGNELEYRGELRPFAQQTFRPLQHAAKPGELWVAIPDSEKNATDVGTIDTRTFTFKPLLRVPRIKFDSMGMWVDEPHQRVYFVYRGHLLSLPLGTTKEPVRPTRH